MAKPKEKREPERRTEMVKVRCFPSEKQQMSATASAAGLTISDYMRTMGTRGRVVIVQSEAPPRELIFAVNKNGVLLNQIARALHANGQPVPGELAQAVREVNAWLAEAKRLDYRRKGR